MPRGHFSDTFIRKLAAFFPCPKCRPEVKVKNFGLSILAEENSKQPSIDTGVWLLVLTLIKKIIMKKSKLSREKYLRRQGTPGRMELKPVFREINTLRNWLKGWWIQERSYSTEFSTCGKELKKSLEQDMVMHTFNPSTQKAELVGLCVWRWPGLQTKFTALN